MAKWTDVAGTLLGYLRLGLTGVRLKNDSGNLAVRNAGDSADAEVTASKVNVSGDNIVINSDAGESDADWKITVARPATGMTANWTLTLPSTNGSPDQVLSTDGNGNTTWADAGTTGSSLKCDETALAHGDSSPVSMFTLPAGARIEKVQCIVYTAFNGTAPSASVGIAGSTSKYMAATSLDLKTTGIYEVHPGLAAEVGTEDLIITYSADGSDAGAATFEVIYSIPS